MKDDRVIKLRLLLGRQLRVHRAVIGVSSYAYEIQNKQENTPSSTYESLWNGEETGRKEEERKCEVLKHIFGSKVV